MVAQRGSTSYDAGLWKNAARTDTVTINGSFCTHRAHRGLDGNVDSHFRDPVEDRDMPPLVSGRVLLTLCSTSSRKISVVCNAKCFADSVERRHQVIRLAMYKYTSNTGTSTKAIYQSPLGSKRAAWEQCRAMVCISRQEKAGVNGPWAEMRMDEVADSGSGARHVAKRRPRQDVATVVGYAEVSQGAERLEVEPRARRLEVDLEARECGEDGQDA